MAASAAALASVPASTDVYLSRDEALALAYPGARIEARSFAPGDGARQAVSDLARVRDVPKLVNVHVAWYGDSLAGVAFFDSRNVRTMPGVFMVAVAPDTTVARVDVVAFHEPPDYRPPARWLSQFERRRLDDRLWPRRDIRNLSGATLSARAVTESVRLSLAYYEVVVSPALRADGARAPRKGGR